MRKWENDKDTLPYLPTVPYLMPAYHSNLVRSIGLDGGGLTSENTTPWKTKKRIQQTSHQKCLSLFLALSLSLKAVKSLWILITKDSGLECLDQSDRKKPNTFVFSSFLPGSLPPFLPVCVCVSLALSLSVSVLHSPSRQHSTASFLPHKRCTT